MGEAFKRSFEKQAAALGSLAMRMGSGGAKMVFSGIKGLGRTVIKNPLGTAMGVATASQVKTKALSHVPTASGLRQPSFYQ